MSSEVRIEFVGFEAKTLVREYTFSVREPAGDPREFTLTILNQAFQDRRLRFQDAPDVCSSRLRRELMANGNHPSETHFHITHAELDDYRNRHASPKRSMFHRPRDEEY